MFYTFLEKVSKAAPIYLLGLRIRRPRLWGNGKKIKVLSDPLLKIIFIFIIFADGRTGTVSLFLFLLSQPTDIWSSFVLKLVINLKPWRPERLCALSLWCWLPSGEVVKSVLTSQNNAAGCVSVRHTTQTMHSSLNQQSNHGSVNW